MRDLMNEVGLICIPSVDRSKDAEVRDYKSSGGGNRILTHMPYCYRWINVHNPAEEYVSAWDGQGMDSSEKGIGKASTYAKKSYLFDMFNIPRDDDPDKFENDHNMKPAAKTTKTYPSREAAQADAAALVAQQTGQPVGDVQQQQAAQNFAGGTPLAPQQPQPSNRDYKVRPGHAAITLPQMVRLWTIADRDGPVWNDQSVHAYIQNMWNLASLWEVSKSQYQTLCGDSKTGARGILQGDVPVVSDDGVAF